MSCTARTVFGAVCIPEPAPVWPALRPEAPAQMPRRSNKSTRCPACASRHEIDVPVTPPPTTMTSGGRPLVRAASLIVFSSAVRQRISTRRCIARRRRKSAGPVSRRPRGLPDILLSGPARCLPPRNRPSGSPMRNLLGRLHARRLPELLRIAEAWSVPLYVESKSEVVGALYRAMTDPRTMRDVWDRLDPVTRAMVIALADAPDSALAPTVDELASRLGSAAPDVREKALRLYRAGILFREGDDEPLPIGAMPRLLLPRELALQVRRIQDEMAAGNLAQSPLRVLLELLDDAELEAAAKTWGLRTVPGVARRRDLAARLLRMINDPSRVERVVRGRGRDAVAVWKIVSAAPGPVPLVDVAAGARLGGSDTVTVARPRAALAELEGALLVWHAY